MKKQIATLLALALLVLTGCTAAGNVRTQTDETAANTAAVEQIEEQQAEQAKTEESAEQPEQETLTEESAEQPEDAPAASEAEEEPTDVRVAALKGPTGMGMAYLMDAAQGGGTVGEELVDRYAIELSGDPSQVVSKVIAGEYDIACLPTNSAAAVYRKTEGQIRLLAVNTLGVLHILQYTADGTQAVTDWQGLRGQTIYATGQGANPEYVLDYLLRANGLVPGEDVTVEFCGTHDELTAKCAAGEIRFCMIPEPNATVVLNSVPGFSRVLDLSEAWAQTGSELMMGCVVVQKAFADAHPDAVERFLSAYEESVNRVLQDPQAAAALIAQCGIVPSEAVALQALPGCHLTFVAGSEELRQALEPYYQVLFAANPSSVGGALPDEAFYVWK